MKRASTLLPILTLASVAFSSAALGQHDFHDVHGVSGAVPKLSYDSLFAAAVPLDESAEGRALLDSCLARYGGVDFLKQLQSFRLVYDMESFAGDTIEVVKTFERDRKYRVSHRGETRILNGDHGWYGSPKGQLDFDSETGRYRAELFSYLTLAMPLAMVEEPFDGGIRYGRREEDPLAYLYLEKRDVLMIVVGIDPARSLIMSSEGIVRQGEQSLVFINFFSDHREVDGYLFPHGLTNVSMGLEVGRSSLRSVEVNASFGADHFGPHR